MTDGMDMNEPYFERHRAMQRIIDKAVAEVLDDPILSAAYRLNGMSRQVAEDVATVMLKRFIDETPIKVEVN